MFAERGLKATTVRDIADSAGILSGSLYHHFKSKEQMVEEVMRDFLDWLFTRYEQIIATEPDPLARFIEKNPTLVMLALAFLVMIGLVLIADGFGFHVPKGYVYAAMGFSVGVELLNMIGRNRRARLAAKHEGAAS